VGLGQNGEEADGYLSRPKTVPAVPRMLTAAPDAIGIAPQVRRFWKVLQGCLLSVFSFNLLISHLPLGHFVCVDMLGHV
jgi:hypothetical protein